MSNLKNQFDEFEETLRSIRPVASNLESGDEFAKTLFSAGQQFAEKKHLDQRTEMTRRLQFWRYAIAASLMFVVASVVAIVAWQSKSPPDSSITKGREANTTNTAPERQPESFPQQAILETTFPVDVAWEPSHVDGQLDRGLFAFAWNNRFRSQGKPVESSGDSESTTESVLTLHRELLLNNSL